MRFDLSDATGAILVWQVIARFEVKSESCSNIDSVPIQVNSVRCIYMPISYQPEFWISSSRVRNAPNGVWDDNIAHFDLGLRENVSRYARKDVDEGIGC